jgi:hypothetical protein
MKLYELTPPPEVSGVLSAAMLAIAGPHLRRTTRHHQREGAEEAGV